VTNGLAYYGTQSTKGVKKFYCPGPCFENPMNETCVEISMAQVEITKPANDVTGEGRNKLERLSLENRFGLF
jgi:hypothetical protein